MKRLSKVERQIINELREKGETIKTCTSCLRDDFITGFSPIQDVIEIILVPNLIKFLKGFVTARIDDYDEIVFSDRIPDDISKKEQDELREKRRIDEDIVNDLNGVLKGMERDKISLSLKQLNTLQMVLLLRTTVGEYYEDMDYIKQTIQKAQFDYTNDKCTDCENNEEVVN